MTTTTKFGRVVGALVLLCILLTACGYVGIRFFYPFGRRACALQCMYLVLQNYAKDHEGAFPDGADGFVALQSLYPDYVDGRELAGISGDPEKVQQVLSQQKSLNGVTSWRFIPGLSRDDDSRLAILWEAQSGINADGRRNFNGSRAVLLVGGSITNVAKSSWDGFMNEQASIKSAAEKSVELQ